MNDSTFLSVYADAHQGSVYEFLGEAIRLFDDRFSSDPPLHDWFDRSGHRTLYSGFEHLAGQLREVYTDEYGPPCGWNRPGQFNRDLFVAVHTWDDEYDHDDDQWPACEEAAYAYRREAKWDFAPGKAGTWICAYVPSEVFGSDKDAYYSGNLVGFLILHDRDEDGEYESLAHLWTARAARRKGIASLLIAEARKRFPLRRVEGPVTEDGRGWLEKSWPEGLSLG